MTRTVALIPARAGSKRVPGKNLRSFLGKPLIQWSIEFAVNYERFDHVLVSTDSSDIAAIAESAGAHAPWMRPASLATDTATTYDVAMHALNALKESGACFDQLALLQPTTPLRRRNRWDEAFAVLGAGAHAAVGVRSVEHHPYWTYLIGEDGFMHACYPAQRHRRSQDLPAAFIVSGALYLIKVDALIQDKSFVPSGTCPVLCRDPAECVDIDTEGDWAAAEKQVAEALKENQ